MSDTDIRLPDYTALIGSHVHILAEQNNFNVGLSNVPEIWKETHGKGAVGIILDTGLPQHVDIPISEAQNFSSDPDALDGNGHSTWIGGVSHAIHGNGMGVRGIADDSRIEYYKVLSNGGGGSLQGLLDALDDIIDRVENGETIDSLNLSLGFGQGVPNIKQLEDRFNRLRALNVLAFVAGGNENGPTSQPAVYDSVLAIASINRDLSKSTFSNFGKIDFAAMGHQSYSTWKGNAYIKISGTSMACPIPFAISLLIQSKHRLAGAALTANEMVDHLKKIAFDIGKPGMDAISGHGILKYTSDPDLPDNPPPPKPKDPETSACGMPLDAAMAMETIGRAMVHAAKQAKI
jgi:hypothetical protein